MATNPTRPRLSHEFGELVKPGCEPHIFDVVIVGSGYGGSVAARELAGRQIKGPGDTLRTITVCVLERGREYLPGEFPSRFEEMAGFLRRTDQDTGVVSGPAEGLFDVRMGKDVVALLANGVGGGSLINAGVLLEPELGDFNSTPEAHKLIDGLKTSGWYAAARKALGGATSGANTINSHARASLVAKTSALASLAPGLAKTPPITVSMTKAPNHAGVVLSECTLCGDCMTGCNVGAKDSLDANLLDTAQRAGAVIYSGASVLSLSRGHDDAVPTWELQVCHTDTSVQKRELQPATVKARHVILAAGTLGSTEILLRSRSATLAFSPTLGQGFSCNGDNLSAVHRMKEPTNACADEDTSTADRKVGPTITNSLGLKAMKRSFRLQEFSVPGPMRRIFEELVTTGHALNQLPLYDGGQHGAEPVGAIDPVAVDDGAIARTLLVGTIGHDAANGVLLLPQPVSSSPMQQPTPQGAIRIDWPEARSGAMLEAAHACVRSLVEEARKRNGSSADGPTLIANPMWRLLPEKLEDLVDQPLGPVVTVHPLGGCRIGPRDVSKLCAGVVDEFGRVHDFSKPDAKVHDGLVVLDGSIIPGSLGVNPSLTITATAMRAMEQHCTDWKYEKPAASEEAPIVWERRRSVKSIVPPASAKDTLPAKRGATEVEIVERLRGPMSLAQGNENRRDCIVELTLAYRPLPIGDLMHKLNRQLDVADKPASHLRIYDAQEWNDKHLDIEDDAIRSRHLIVDARVGGSLTVLKREASGPLRRVVRSVWAWLLNRGVRDIAERVLSKDARKSIGSVVSGVVDFFDYGLSLIKMGSRAGEVRCLTYDLRVIEPVMIKAATPGSALLKIRCGDSIKGSKRLTYGRRANPWRQLTEMVIDTMPGMARTARPVLTLDGRFLAGQGFPLLRIHKQRNSVTALADLCSFGLYMARLLAAVHLWTFRKPDAQPRRTTVHLPGPIDGLSPPDVTELVVDRLPETQMPVTLRLTHYRPAVAATKPPDQPAVGTTKPSDPRPPPLVMIHGYSASGNTFTHASLAPSAALYFARLGRDVWVVDLRTSAALATAHYPWSMEQVGLVDIPAALLHIRNVAGQPVDVLAHCIGGVMLSMALLTKASELKHKQLTLGDNVHLTTQQLGTLSAFNGEQAGGAHPCIHRLVLSQKGPVLRYTDANVLRAFIMQSIRRLLVKDEYRFQPSDDPGVMEQLMDRLLASIPYPDAEYDTENPIWPRRGGLPWTATRHRMDALYGRAFEARNMRPQTLAAINDIFGQVNMETVAQTIHFARVHMITNQAGRGEFVTRKRLRDCWGGIETYAIHGAQNGLVDVSTQTLLSEHMGGAGAPFLAADSTQAPYRQVGHQDALMGKSSPAVFADIEEFLSGRKKVSKTPIAFPNVVTLPWSGPRIDPDSGTGNVRIACLSDPTQGSGTLCLVPVVRWTSKSGQGQHHHIVIRDSGCTSQATTPGPSTEWMYGTPPVAALRSRWNTLNANLHRDSDPGWLALIIYDPDETTAVEPPSEPPSDSAESNAVSVGKAAPRIAPPYVRSKGFPLQDKLDLKDFPALAGLIQAVKESAVPMNFSAPCHDDVERWLAQRPHPDCDLAFVSLSSIESAQSVASADRPCNAFTFAFGSCQYASGLLDADVSQASLTRFAEQTDAAINPIDFALFVGDQIYADATAGLIDPVRRDELFDRPNDKALRASGMRAVLRQVPARMLLDDHELKDNWEPLPAKLASRQPDDEAKNVHALHSGTHAWARYQKMQPLVRHAELHGVGDQEFVAGGYPFRFTDTRTGRSARGSTVDLTEQHIFTRDQWKALFKWLAVHKDDVKFIVTPSILLPRRRTSAADPSGSAHSDAWDGFPQSMKRLFRFMSKKQIRNTVFLSGDEHHSMVTEAWISSTLRATVKIISVHSPGLYAPFPFANGHPDDLVADEFIDDFSAVAVGVKTLFAAPGDGFAKLGVRYENGVPQLKVGWIKAGGDANRAPETCFSLV